MRLNSRNFEFDLFSAEQHETIGEKRNNRHRVYLAEKLHANNLTWEIHFPSWHHGSEPLRIGLEYCCTRVKFLHLIKFWLKIGKDFFSWMNLEVIFLCNLSERLIDFDFALSQAFKDSGKRVFCKSN